MLKSSLKSSTCLVLGFTLAAGPLLAQQADVSVEDLDVCPGLAATSEVTADDLVDVEADAAAVFPCLDADGEVIADQEALTAAVEAAAVETAAEAADVVEDGTLDAVADVENGVAEAEAEVAGVSQELAIQTDTLQAQETETTAQADTAVEQDMSTDEALTAETSADTVVETPDTATSDTDVAVSGAGEAGAETETMESGQSAHAAAGEEAAPTVAGMPEGNDQAQIADLPTIGDEDGPSAEAEIAFEQVETEPPAVAAAAEGEADAGAAVEVEELTQDDVRTSAQDFATAAIGDAGNDDDDGLSNFQKALLLGLGAAAVGSIMDNGDEVVSNSGDRVVVERNGELVVLKDDDVLLRQAGSQVRTESFDDGSTRAVVTRPDGSQIVTVRANDGRVLRRIRILEDGTRVVLFDDTRQVDPVIITELQAEPMVSQRTNMSGSDMQALRRALMASQDAPSIRTFSLRQVRAIREVREMAPEVELDTITFATASAAIQPSQAEELTNLSLAILDIIEEDPSQVFLIEGHTDAVGDASYNLALSDRRAETVALAMTEYFGVPPENLITQGYGETILKVPTLGAERENRRAAVRNITALLQ